nr:hypothetical protein [Tanacetum cinerariifolium]
MNDELPQTFPGFDPTCYSKKENSVPYVSKPNFVDEPSNIFNPPPQHPIYSCEFCGSNAQYGHYCTPQAQFNNLEQEKRIEEEQAANARYWKIPACCDDDDDYDSAITPVLSTEEPIDSLSMGDEHLDTIPATESDEVIKSSVENLIPIPSEFKGIPDTMCDVHLDNNHTPLKAKDHLEIVLNSNDDISSNDDDSLHEENIEYVEASPHDFELSSSASLNSFLEETNTFHNSLLKFENFYFDLGEISSGSTTPHFDISLPDYEAFSFNDDHIKEISSGSTTTHSDISLSEYDSELPDPGELMSVLNSEIHENLSTTLVNLPIEDDYSPLVAYVVWTFVAYLTLLHLAGSQPMLKSSYKVEDGVIISIPSLVRGVAVVVVEIKGTG